MNINVLVSAGGLLFLLTFVHFFVDWLFQTHKEAVLKTRSTLIRARHCLIYTVGFIPILILMRLELWELYTAIMILFFSHFLEDTYLPVYLWARYIRKPPEMFELNKYKVVFEGSLIDYPANHKDGFMEFSKTPLGRIIIITVDQIIHITFLIPLVWMALN